MARPRARRHARARAATGAAALADYVPRGDTRPPPRKLAADSVCAVSPLGLNALVSVLGRFDELARLGGGDDAPGIPGDLDDHECNQEADDRVSSGEAERDEGGARDDTERDEAVDACVVAVCDQGWAR